MVILEPFLRLQETVKRYGVVRSLEALPKSLFEQASAYAVEKPIQAHMAGIAVVVDGYGANRRTLSGLRHARSKTAIRRKCVSF